MLLHSLVNNCILLSTLCSFHYCRCPEKEVETEMRRIQYLATLTGMDTVDFCFVAYLAALTGVDTVVEPGRLVPTNSAKHTVVPVKF